MKTVCITGASRGLGKITAEFFFKSGWHIAIVSRNLKALQEVAENLAGKYSRSPLEIIVIDADLSLPNAGRHCIETMKKRWLSLNALVNNAGIQGPIGPFCDINSTHWEDAFKTLLFAPLDMCRHAIPWMASTGGGNIVNLSGGGAASPRANFTAYAAAKTALIRTTEILALEYKPYNIAVNAVAPGIMPTRLLAEVLTAGAETAGEKEYEAAQNSYASEGHSETMSRAAECIFKLCSQTAPKVTGKLISAVWDPWQKIEQYAEELASSDIYTLRRITPEDRAQNRRTQT